MTSFTIYKCPVCGAEKSLTDDEQKNLRRLFCGSCEQAAEMREDRIEVYGNQLRTEVRSIPRR